MHFKLSREVSIYQLKNRKYGIYKGVFLENREKGIVVT